MKVLYIIDYGTIGGATKAFVEMVLSEKKLGVHPIVITSKYNEINSLLEKNKIPNLAVGHYTVFEPFNYDGIRSLWWLLKMTIRYYTAERKAFNLIRKHISLDEIDIIHSNTNRCTLGCLINKKYNIPHVMHIREFADKDFGCISLRPFYIRYFNKFTSEFFSVSNAVMQYWNMKGIHCDKNHLIYDGVKCENILESKKQKTDCLHMVIVGGVCKAKGQIIAVKAFEFIPPKIREKIHLDIIGWCDNEYLDEIIHITRKLNVTSNVHYLGAMPNVYEILCNYNIGLMCSLSEGFGLVTAEYMHARLGVIASNSGANPELITNGESGLLFAVNDPKDLARCIMMFYEDRDLLELCSHNAYDKAKATYTSINNAQQIYNEYLKILN